MKSVYTDYFQKSKTFIYPLLLIPRGTSVTPMGSYTSLNDLYTHKDYRLILEYHLRDDKEFKTFEKARLFGNPLFHDFFETDHKTGVYIFNLEDYKTDWDFYLDGRYSMFSSDTKNIIQNYYRSSKKNFVYVDSFLNPHMYYEIYSNILDCKKEILEQVVELCDKPNFDKESLVVDIKKIDLGEIHLNL